MDETSRSMQSKFSGNSPRQRVGKFSQMALDKHDYQEQDKSQDRS